MEHGACNVIYIDRRANDEHVRRETLSKSLAARTSTGNVQSGYFSMTKPPSPREIHENVEVLLSTFNEVHICASGSSCIAKISQILDSMKDNVPIIVLIDVPYDEEQRLKRLSREPRTPSPTASQLVRINTGEPDDIYGTHLLTYISSEIASRNFTKLVVPVLVLSGFSKETASDNLSAAVTHGAQVLGDTVRLARYLDAGAVDVLSSPLSKDNVHGLAVHAYRVHKEANREETNFMTTKRNRKLSWVGTNDTKPYAYLREAMVSSLMGGICNPEMIADHIDPGDIFVEEARKEVISQAVGTWGFSAHDFNDDELLYGALLILKHALQVPELTRWSIPDDELTVFLLASRTAYNEFVLYHNFRHVVDVLQALFHFVVEIGILPPYPNGSAPLQDLPPAALSQLLRPIDALTLLISAIGHDVGHPGVNNAFLVALNAPLAQLYNDRSVLESFHCAAYSQILRRYWPKVFADAGMRRLMINSILATDMGLHFRYMTDLGNVQQKLAHDEGMIESWSVKIREENKDLTCGLLIKCADICNVARKFETAAQWANILTDEFSNQGVMEQELQMPSCLFGGPPVRDDMIKLGESQIGFMNIFARPLFEAVTDVLPAMRFALNEILKNKAIWDKRIADEKKKLKKHPKFSLGLLSPSFAADPTPSPFSGGPLRSPIDMSRLPTTQTNRSAQTQPKSPLAEEVSRRGSAGSAQGGVTSSRRSSSGVDKSSRRSSGIGAAGVRSRENQASSRRGSGDASLTAILVTQTPKANEPIGNGVDHESKHHPSQSPGQLRDASVNASPVRDKETARPVTAPSQVKPRLSPEAFPIPKPTSQSHSEVDLSHGANGNLDGGAVQKWPTNKTNDDNHVSPSDGARDQYRRSEWWRQMSTRRPRKDAGEGEGDVPPPPQENQPRLDPTNTSSTSDANSPTTSSPGRSSRTGKLRSFFKRRPRAAGDQRKQSSSLGSSSQIRTPPTSDPGQSLTSDDEPRR